MEKILKYAFELANKELKKCDEYLFKNKSAWNETHDLKMYNASFMNCDKFEFELKGARVCFDDDYIENEFDFWCECEYNNFVEWQKENDIDRFELLNYIGRTSQFYIGNFYNEFFSDILADSTDYGKTNIILDDKGLIDYDKTLEEYDGKTTALVEDLLLVANNVYSDLDCVLGKIIKVHNYIQDFKNNQCDYFREFVIDNWKNNL